MKTFKVRALSAAVLAGSAVTPGLLYASTAANTTLTNTVTVNYADTAGAAQAAVQDTVSFTVNLVTAAPTVSTPGNVASATENTSVALTYTVTGNANGEDSYSFSIADTRGNMDADATLTAAVNVTLGGTTLAADAALTDTSITVPFDGNSADNIVNGIAAGETIIIGGNAYIVGTIDEAGSLTGNTVVIPLTTAIAGTTGTTGDIVGESVDVNVGITTDEVTTGTSGTHGIIATATSTTSPNPAGSQAAATTITVARPVLAVTKYVRNVTAPVVGGTPITVGGATYYDTGVNGAPGDEMEYLIEIDNSTAGASNATDIVVSDPIPQFTSYVTSTIELDPGTGTFAGHLDGGNDGDAAEVDVSGNGTVYVYAGTGGDDNGAADTGTGINDGDGGSLAAGDTSYVRFRTTID